LGDTNLSVCLNLVVIRAADLDRSAGFYGRLGLTFECHRHGQGPEHLASQIGEVVFEIYPAKEVTDRRESVRIGVAVEDVDALVRTMTESGGTIVSLPSDSPWGRRAVVADPDGHRVEITARSRD
jgi:predicted enzyme related to lactoylglutathione lyase